MNVKLITIARLWKFAYSRLTGPRAKEVLHLCAKAMANAVTGASQFTDPFNQDYVNAMALTHVLIQDGQFHRARWTSRDWYGSQTETLGYSHACGYHD